MRAARVYLLTDLVPRPVDTSAIAQEISTYLEPYSSLGNGRREAHLRELCRLGQELREHRNSHPSEWTFGPWDEKGFIVMAPPLFKDGTQVADRQIFRRV